MDVFGFVEINNWLLLLFFLLISVYMYFTWHFNYFESRGIHGPKPIPIFGTAKVMLSKGALQMDMEFTQKYGDVYGTFEGRSPVLVVKDPEILKHVLIKDNPTFINRKASSVANGKYVVSMLNNARDEHWKVLRSTISPTFSTGKLRMMTKHINECAQDLVNNMAQEADTGKPFEVKEYAGSFTMDVIVSTSFGLKIDSQKDKNNQFVVMAKKAFTFNFAALAYYVTFYLPFLQPVVRAMKIDMFGKEAIDFFKEITYRTIDARAEDGQTRVDFMQLLMNAHKETVTEDKQEDKEHDKDFKDMHKGVKKRGLTEEEVVGQSVLFFLVGYDTTASSIAFLIYNLAVCPDIQEKLCQEICDVAGDGEIDYNLLCQMNLLDMCVHESLRIFPPAVRIDRESNRDVTINGVEIPKGMDVVIPIYAIHHDPNIWPEPEKFDPYRFTPEEKAKHGPLDWIPFGAGPRNCVAMRLALTEFKIAIAYLVRKYKFVRCDKTEIPIKLARVGLLAAQNGIWVQAEKR